MGKKRAVLYRENWDSEFFADMKRGIGFQITEPVEISLDGSKERSLYGAQSPLYGTTYGDESEAIKRYRCRCGALRSRQYEGEICQLCGEPVQARDSNINITGYISLKATDAHVIQPLYFRILSQAIGKEFAEIIFSKKKVDTDGNQSFVTKDDLDFTPSTPYYGIGLVEFYKRYDEIMDYYINLPSRKGKKKSLQILKKSKRSVFCQHIPIYSTLLRPQSITQDTFYYQGADKLINPIFKLCDRLENCEPIEWDYYMQRIQVKLNALWDYNFDLIHGKDGIIRGSILGGSLNYTSRNVIVPDPTLKDNEIDLSYHTMRELFKPKIISYLQIAEDISFSKAEEIWEKAFIFDEKVYEIMEMIIKNENITIIINRNPTLNYYSMLRMKVRKVKRSGRDYCLSVPLSILSGLNADFDGDIINMIAILDPAISYMFRKFDPIERMIVARDTGLLNPYFDVEKSQLIVLYDFLNCGALPGDTPETFPDEEFTQQEWEKPITVHKAPELKYNMKDEDFIDFSKNWIPAEMLIEPSKRKTTKARAVRTATKKPKPPAPDKRSVVRVVYPEAVRT